MRLAYDALINEQNAAISRDSAWLGSEAHLGFLERTVRSVPGLADVPVSWVAPGQPGYWEAATRTITAERPRPTPGLAQEYVAKVVLFGILHDTLHARQRSPATEFKRRLGRLDPRLLRAVERLFNLLEDGRITPLGKAADRDIALHLTAHAARPVA